MKKQPLNPKAKRDFSVLDRMDRNKIAAWLMGPYKLALCPLANCSQCRALFPEIVGKIYENGLQKHPCDILYLQDVILIAEQAIVWKTERNK